MSERRFSNEYAVNTSTFCLDLAGLFPVNQDPGVVLEVNSLSGWVNSDEAAVTPLAMSVVASKGAIDSSSVASVMQPPTLNHKLQSNTEKIFLINSSTGRNARSNLAVYNSVLTEFLLDCAKTYLRIRRNCFSRKVFQTVGPVEESRPDRWIYCCFPFAASFSNPGA